MSNPHPFEIDFSRYDMARARVMLFGAEGTSERYERYRRIAATLHQTCSEILALLRREVIRNKIQRCRKRCDPNDSATELRINRPKNSEQRDSSVVYAVARDVVAHLTPVIARAIANQRRRTIKKRAESRQSTTRLFYERDRTLVHPYGLREFDESKHPRAPAGHSDGGQFVRIKGASGVARGEYPKLDDLSASVRRHRINQLRQSKNFPEYSISADGTLIDPRTRKPVELAGPYYWATGNSQIEGHHWVPRQVWNMCNSILSKEAIDTFDTLKTDPKLINHGFDTWKDLEEVCEGAKGGVSHHQYNKSVGELLKQFHASLLGRTGRKLTADEATAFARFIAEGKIPEELPRDMKRALSTLAKTNTTSLLTVQKWRTGFYDAIGLAQHLVDAAKENGRALTKPDVKILVRRVLGTIPSGWSAMSKEKRDLALKFLAELDALPPQSRMVLWTTKVRGGTVKALGWSLDKLPYLGAILAVGAFAGSGGAVHAAEGHGQYVPGVDGTTGVALNVGALLAREGVAADQVEWVFKSAIDSASKIGVLGAPAIDVRQRGAKNKIDLFQEERGLFSSGSPALRGRNEVSRTASDEWKWPLDFLNPR